MTNTGELFGYKKDVSFFSNGDGDFCQITYSGYKDSYFVDKILHNSIALAEIGVGPPIYYYQVKPGFFGSFKSTVIVYKAVTSLNNFRKNEELKNIPNEEIIEKLNLLVEIMHKNGYAHGDLGISNFGFDSNKRFYIIDHDTVFKISEAMNLPWLKIWMMKFSDYEDYQDFERFKEEDFERFIKYDFENFRTDWLNN